MSPVPSPASSGLSRHQSILRRWLRRVPWYVRLRAKTSFEAKLVMSFTAILCAMLTMTSLLLGREMRNWMSSVMSDQTAEMATALASSSERALRVGDWTELKRRAGELVSNRNILYVGYFDSEWHLRAIAGRDMEFALSNIAVNPRPVTQVRQKTSSAFGNYSEAIAPSFTSAHLSGSSETIDPPARLLLGYVVIGMSQNSAEAAVERGYMLAAFGGSMLVLLAVPLALLMVHHIAGPIRRLVRTTQKVAAGDLAARARIHRTDVIGELSQSFDEMASRIHRQQKELASKNIQLAAANRGLEERIAQRTAQLEKANSRLSAEINEKEDFLRAVSHDLGAPLRNISGMTSTILDKFNRLSEDEVMNRLERIRANVEIETDLISEILELSRIKSRRLELDELDLRALILELQGVFENDLKSRGILLSIDTPLPLIRAERARMRQVFQNLIDNAIKYMGQGSVREIHIGCEHRPGEVEFYVHDSGLGIEAEDLEKVFFVFRRGRNASAHGISGKGVGLASVKSIIETYSGKIWVSSRPGGGSIFRFTINGKHLVHESATASI
jgi:signal transduction histidine kinase